MSIDPYEALGLSKTASAEEIKKAYRKIARNSHPDLNPSDADAAAKFKAASAAYDLLKDPETRARFDRGEIDASGAEQQQRRYYRDYAERADNPYRRAGHPGGGTGAGEAGFGDASDIFAEFFRQQGGGGRQEGQFFNARGSDLRYALEVPFLDAALGGKTRITLPDGAALEVSIPQGTAEGQTIRLRGKGAPGFGEGPPGDALITISIAPHPHFRREGDDILLDLPITIDEALLGGKVAVPTIGGRVNLNIPKGASSGRVLRLKGRGVARRGAAAGDQLVSLKVVMPPEVDAELADFIGKWRREHGYDPRKEMM
ncbi:DnaJ C-terminal domain-containing protein [Sulfitobacter aestuarii]|uniref:DnaJ C-terminal domain-containing protein n=1 Tax=Sulfitobacter aestuarii TaxID=2161676 RepID=A0ABW5U3T4_9RHOB